MVNENISNIIGDDCIHVSEFIVAKIKGKIIEHNGHPEVTDDIFLKIPATLQNPCMIFKDDRHPKKFLFIGELPMYEIVVEVKRIESGRTEINTVHIIDSKELKRLERKFPALLVLARPQ